MVIQWIDMISVLLPTSIEWQRVLYECVSYHGANTNSRSNNVIVDLSMLNNECSLYSELVAEICLSKAKGFLFKRHGSSIPQHLLISNVVSNRISSQDNTFYIQ